MRASAQQALLTLSGSLVRALRHREPYSPQEVRTRLLDEMSQGDPRTAAVHAAASEVGAWMRLLPGDAGASTASALPRPGSQRWFFGIARVSHLKRLGGASHHSAAAAMATAPLTPPARSSRCCSTADGRENSCGPQTTGDDLEIDRGFDRRRTHRESLGGLGGCPAAA